MAPITPGTHAHRVRAVTRRTEPQPLSSTARGGKMMHNMARRQDMFSKVLCRALTCQNSEEKWKRILGKSF